MFGDNLVSFVQSHHALAQCRLENMVPMYVAQQYTCIELLAAAAYHVLQTSKMAPIEMAASLLVLRKLCSILFFNVLFLTLLVQKTLSVITYCQEELLDIRETSTHQHNYDQ